MKVGVAAAGVDVAVAAGSGVLVGAGVGITKDLLDRVAALQNVGADVIALDSAHGHSKGVIAELKDVKKNFKKINVIAGNVGTAAGAKALAEAGAEIIIGTWAPIYRIFTTSWANGKFNESRQLPNGKMLEYLKVYPMDAVFDKMEDVPQEVRENKRYADLKGYTISEVAKQVHQDFGHIDILVHSLANAPEVTKNLLDTSRQGYLAAMSSSSYSFISLVAHFGP
jgi:NAD(P)-dependent dehydrogenase (short-subunit alcohol dehydrogenase family)